MYSFRNFYDSNCAHSAELKTLKITQARSKYMYLIVYFCTFGLNIDNIGEFSFLLEMKYVKE